MEQTYMLLSSIVAVHIKTGIAGELSPRVLNLVGKFTEYLSFY
jgi:hypothetical protein